DCESVTYICCGSRCSGAPSSSHESVPPGLAPGTSGAGVGLLPSLSIMIADCVDGPLAPPPLLPAVFLAQPAMARLMAKALTSSTRTRYRTVISFLGSFPGDHHPAAWPWNRTSVIRALPRRPRIQCIPHGVAEQVEGEHQYEDHDSGNDEVHRIRQTDDELRASVDHAAQVGCRFDHPDIEERQRRLRGDRRGDGEREADQDRRPQ